MTTPARIDFKEQTTGALEAALTGAAGVVAVFVTADGRLDAAGRRVNTLTRKALTRVTAASAWAKANPARPCGWPFRPGWRQMR